MISRVSLGINVGILLTLLILGALFSLPLKLLLDTNRETGGFDEQERGRSADELPQADYRRMKLCGNPDYKSLAKLVHLSNYDGNCTKPKRPDGEKSRGRFAAERYAKRFAEDTSDQQNVSTHQKNSISIAGHILAVLLVGSAVAALVEVLRVRLFAAVKRSDGGVATVARKSSLVDLAQRRAVRKETVQAQKSFEIQGMMHRSPLRLLAARPPPLLRRSSFPAQCLGKKDQVPISTTVNTGRLSRRPSFVIDSEEDVTVLTDTSRRRCRLIRRH
ncbi:uncharacterized protein LOC124303482 isoform X1 [Neodiprion virginianus]|uniref:uncharacterized protein LOC124303482 isoform X1 n=1 Tax=Neodiprion virginianus TaxID=2961670 RepID=UPI001EE6FFA1|nr:uncharacterized protein LOC124303482 isoform X1 [Neodiprion virginianus]XP_046616690.1 uncharacterized protein LOC124303482 isoform X1 [Neodiprion virginianus]